MTEPLIRVGLVEGAALVRLRLEGRYTIEGKSETGTGDYVVARDGGAVVLSGGAAARTEGALRLSPVDFEPSRVTVHDVTIGKDFHWQRRQSQDFQGSLECLAGGNGLT